MRGTAKTMVKTFFVVDREARRFFVMERTAGLKLAASLCDLNGAANQRGKRDPRA